MDRVNAEERVTTSTRKFDPDTYKLWHGKPVSNFCLGFSAFVMAEILVDGTLHWIFPLI